jgi:hypothetical protein
VSKHVRRRALKGPAERAGWVSVSIGTALAIVVYVLVAPFRCDVSGVCHGLVAFDYAPDSAGHWQALGAGALVGSTATVLVFAVLAEGHSRIVLRVVLTPLLVAALVVSLLSHSALIIIGPVITGFVLWGLWAGGRAQHRADAEPPPIYERSP